MIEQVAKASDESGGDDLEIGQFSGGGSLSVNQGFLVMQTKKNVELEADFSDKLAGKILPGRLLKGTIKVEVALNGWFDPKSIAVGQAEGGDKSLRILVSDIKPDFSATTITTKRGWMRWKNESQDQEMQETLKKLATDEATEEMFKDGSLTIGRQVVGELRYKVTDFQVESSGGVLTIELERVRR